MIILAKVALIIAFVALGSEIFMYITHKNESPKYKELYELACKSSTPLIIVTVFLLMISEV